MKEARDLEVHTSHSSRGSYDHINDCFLWQLVSSLHFERPIDRTNDCVAVLRERRRPIGAM